MNAIATEIDAYASHAGAVSAGWLERVIPLVTGLDVALRLGVNVLGLGRDASDAMAAVAHGYPRSRCSAVTRCDDVRSVETFEVIAASNLPGGDISRFDVLWRARRALCRGGVLLLNDAPTSGRTYARPLRQLLRDAGLSRVESVRVSQDVVYVCRKI